MAAKTSDPYAARGKQLGSAVQKLRGWVGSDPSRTPELADALAEVTEHRLLGHRFAEAVPDAQESAAMAGKLLTAEGPLGPYTPVAAAARYLTAAVHLATIQHGLGLDEAAGKTISAALEFADQLPELDLRPALSVTTIAWLLSGAGRVALEAGDVARGNAYADAVLVRIADLPAAESYAAMDAERFVGGARWAAGLTAEALVHADRARVEHDRIADGRLARAGQLSPALVARLAEPLFVVRSEQADRLMLVGDHDRALDVRRNAVELLRGLVKPLPDTAPGELATALADLVADLESGDRSAEAEVVRAEAGAPRSRTAPGSRLDAWPALAAREAFAVDGGGSLAAELEAAAARQAAERAAEERAEAHRREEERQREARRELDRIEAERVEAARLEAEQVEAARATADQEAAEEAERERLAAEQRVADEQAAREETKRRREERLAAHRLEVERAEAERLAAERRRAAERDPAEAERQELERLEAELAALEAEESPPEPVEGPELVEEPEPAPPIPEPVEGRELVEEPEPAPPIPEPVEGPDRDAADVPFDKLRERQDDSIPEPVEGPDRDAADVPFDKLRDWQEDSIPEPVEGPPELAEEPEPSELDLARDAWRTARLSGDRKAVRAATERVSDLLRPLAAQDPQTYGPELIDALQQLSSARLRGGDLFGSRGPAREAKALARELGR